MLSIPHLKAAMLGITSLGALALANGRSTAPPRPPQEPVAFVVVIREGTLDLSRKGISTHTCMFVRPDGRFHLERRTQQLPSTTATAKIFDYSLDSSQLQQLQNMIDDTNIRQLPVYVQPVVPMGVTWSHGFEAKIARASGIQDVGYWTWRGGTGDASPNSAPVSVKSGWRESEAALKPLLDWLRNIGSLKLAASDTESALCSGE